MKTLLSFSLMTILVLSGFIAYSPPNAITHSFSNGETELPATVQAKLKKSSNPNISSQSSLESAAQQPSGSVQQSGPSVISPRTYGGAGDDGANVVIQTSDSGFALAGYTSSWGAEQHDFRLIKTDNFGNLQWSRTYGGANDDYAYSVVQTSDGGFALVGGTKSFGAGDSDVWLVKTDASGNVQWNKTYGGIWTDWGYSIIETLDRGLAIAGWTASFGLGGGDFWLIKTDSLGKIEWSRTYGDLYLQDAWGVQRTSDDGYALIGNTYSYGSESSDIWLVKTDNVGNAQWSKTYGGTGDEYAYSLVQTTDNGFAIAGSTSSIGSGVYDFWLIKTDSNGNVQWSNTYGGTGYDEAWSVRQTIDYGFALAGWTESYGSGGSDCWMIKTDASGSLQWDFVWGGTNYDYAYSVVLDASGGYELAGKTSSMGAGSYDALLISLRLNAPSGGSGGGRRPVHW